MSVYIIKNNQQTGPFAESAVLEMLKSGQLSPDGLAIRQGESQWKPVGSMFSPPAKRENSSSLPNNNQTQPASDKGGNSKVLWFALFGVGGFVLLTILGVGAFFVLSGKKSSSESLAGNTANSNNSKSNSAASTSLPSLDEAKLKILQNKAEELVNMSPTQKIETNPIIKGKVAIVEKDGYEAEILGFDAYGKEYFGLETERYGISIARLATSVEEIDTLIQIHCTKGKQSGSYQGGIKGFTNVCKVAIIDYRTPAVIAQQTFTNSTPPKKISTLYKDSGEYVFPKPDEAEEFISSLPLEKLADLPTDLPYDDRDGTYGKYTSFKLLAAEFTRVSFPLNIDQNAVLKGKIAIVEQDASGRSDLKGIDPFGKELYKHDYEKWGVGKEKLAENVNEIETLVKINCRQGNRLGAVRRTTVYANQCVVSIVDYKNSVTVFQKTFENNEMDTDIDNELYPTKYVVLNPYQEIDEFIKGLPKS